MKRKGVTSIENVAAPPAKVGKRSVPLGRNISPFAAARNHDRPGQVMVMGKGEFGQLGLGQNVMERSRPSLVPGLTDVVDVCAGGMHTVCLNNIGEVFTMGCNDEGALGRLADDEEECSPGQVLFNSEAVQVSAGDSHSAALLQNGTVYAWGAFRDSHGTMGLVPEGNVPLPMLMKVKGKVVQIASGTDHLLMLTEKGQLYSCGCGEQGQLGRLTERTATRKSRDGMKKLLVPALVTSKLTMKLNFDRIWKGDSCTFAREKARGDIFVCGLNNYRQLGLDNIQCCFQPQLSEAFAKKRWQKICGGQHHTLALDTEGVVYALGRKDYGRLGLGENCSDADLPTIIPTLRGKKCVDISCGTSVSFAVTDEGALFSWGMGDNHQLGTGSEDDQWEPVQVTGKNLEGRAVLRVSGGGQHTVLLAKAINTEKS